MIARFREFDLKFKPKKCALFCLINTYDKDVLLAAESRWTVRWKLTCIYLCHFCPDPGRARTSPILVGEVLGGTHPLKEQ